MRFVVTALACAGVLAAVAGCDPVDKHYFTQGVGTRLSSDDVASEVKQTELQNAYVAEICRQAGLQPTSPAEGIVTCVGSDARTTWTLFVQAGMNDIDQRCDAYLTWLDEFKRSRDPILNQISQTGTVTQNIMLAAGIHQVPITIVGDAFGLAHNTFTNLGTSLILELPHSTVQAVVLGNQQRYRDEVFGTPGNLPVIAVTSRPAAIYVLRSYLRYCMPMTIATQVNSSATTVALGGFDAPLMAPNNAGKTVAPTIIVQTKFKPDDLTELLNKWLRPNGVLDNARLETMRAFASKVRPGLQVQNFLTGGFADARAQFARAQGLIQ